MGDLMFPDTKFFYGWLQPQGPNTQMLFGGGCLHITGDPTVPHGDVTLLRCQDPVNPGGMVTVGQRTGTPGNPTAQIRMPLDTQKYLMEIADRGCDFNVQMRYTACKSPNQPDSWEYVYGLKNCRITQDATQGFNMGELDALEGNPLMIVADVVFEERYLIPYPTLSSVTVTAVSGAHLVDISMCDVPSCPGACGAGSAGCLTGHAISANGSVEQVHTTIDGGATWSAQDSPFAVIYDTLSAIDCAGDLVIVTNGTTAGLVARSTDGGATWAIVDTGITSVLTDVFVLDGANVWVTGAGGEIAYSGNGGATWTIQDDGTQAGGAQLNEIVMYDTEVGLAVGNGGVIVRTLDGSAWAAVTSGTAQNLNTVAWVTEFVWFAGGAAGTLRYTMNRGTTWAARAGFFAGTDVVNSIKFCGQIGTAVGETVGGDGIVWYTIDGGYFWQLIHTESSTPLNAVECCKPEKFFIAGDDGTALIAAGV